MQRVNSTSFRWTMDAAGDWLCIQTNKARQVLDSLKEGQVYDVEIKEHREKRSLDANAYFWVLVDRLAEKLRIPTTEIYRRYIREIGGNHEMVCVIDSAVEKLRNGWEHNGLGWQTDTMASRIPGCTNVILYYPGLESSPSKALADKQFEGNGYGGMLCVNFKGGQKEIDKLISNLQLVRFVPTLAGVGTTLTYPPRASHRDLSPDELAAIGITMGQIRLSSGLEDTDDLLNDFDQALAKM